MKVLVAAAIAAAALSIGGDVRRAKKTSVRLVAETPMELRSAPDGGAPIRGTLAAGASFEIAVRQGNWTLVRSDKEWGWVIRTDLPAKP